MVLMLLIIGVICGLVALTVITIRRVRSYESYLPDYEDILLCEQTGDGSQESAEDESSAANCTSPHEFNPFITIP